ncbi:MAG: hypothetical protein WAM69_06095 [Candidatus Sulfotelmatobacter sp.]
MFSITFVNPFDVSVQVEIRAGSEQNCDQNGTVFSDALGPNASWTLNTGENVVCYRRTADPAVSGGPFNEWGTFSPDSINTPANIQL